MILTPCRERERDDSVHFIIKIADITGIINTIINGFKDFLSKLEQMSKDVVSEIAQKSEEVAQKIQILLTKAFADIKARISSLIRNFKAKIESLSKKKLNTNTGPNASGFSQRLRSAVKSIENDAERVFHDTKTEAVAMAHEARDMIRRMSDGLGAARGDVTTFVRKTGKDVFGSLIALGEGAVSKVSSFVDSAFHDLELDGSFVASHALQVGELAVLTAFNPLMFGGFALAGIIMLSSHSLAESIKNDGQIIQSTSDSTQHNGQVIQSTSRSAQRSGH